MHRPDPRPRNTARRICARPLASPLGSGGYPLPPFPARRSPTPTLIYSVAPPPSSPHSKTPVTHSTAIVLLGGTRVAAHPTPPHPRFRLHMHIPQPAARRYPGGQSPYCTRHSKLQATRFLKIPSRKGTRPHCRAVVRSRRHVAALVAPTQWPQPARQGMLRLLPSSPFASVSAPPACSACLPVTASLTTNGTTL